MEALADLVVTEVLPRLPLRLGGGGGSCRSHGPLLAARRGMAGSGETWKIMHWPQETPLTFSWLVCSARCVVTNTTYKMNPPMISGNRQDCRLFTPRPRVA